MFKTIGMIARWKPVHLGHAAILRALRNHAEQAIIGIGSSNRYNLRNPFTLEETRDMLQLVLGGQNIYTLIPVPDLDDGPRWRLMARKLFGELELFVTDNPYVAHLLRDDYRVVRPVELIPRVEQIRVDGTMVRALMARGAEWETLVPESVAAYIKSNQLDVRFRNEFGLETIASNAILPKEHRDDVSEAKNLYADHTDPSFHSG
jgi:cytidyltransferase-like protein